MLELKNVTITLQKDTRRIIDNFSFTLGRKDKAVIIGEEGNGKSTVLKFIYNKCLIDGYCEYTGDVITRGKMAYLPQIMDERYYETSLLQFFEASEYYMHTDILAKLGLSIDFIVSEQRLGTLSGGERVKVQLARLLMERPDILLLDEPTNDLDIEALQWLESFIKNSELPIIYISHDEILIENTANVIVHMEQIIRKTKSRISVARCSYREYLSFRQNNFEHQSQIAQKQRDDYDNQMEKWRQIYNRVEHDQRAITRQDPGGARLLKKKMRTVISMGKRFEREKENFIDFPQREDAILTKFDESISLPYGKMVLDFSLDNLQIGERVLSKNIKLFVRGNEKITIIGGNGVGKTTLLALIWNELKNRRDITAAYMPQNYCEVLDYSKTPVEYLVENYSKSQMTKARTYMGSMKFTHEEMTGRIGDLSGGQRAKILFLDMVLKGADVLLLDEPTRNFSPLSGPVVRAALKSFGGAVISVSHDRKYLNEVSDRIYKLSESGLSAIDGGIV